MKRRRIIQNVCLPSIRLVKVMPQKILTMLKKFSEQVAQINIRQREPHFQQKPEPSISSYV